jgi:hypothetical protein
MPSTTQESRVQPTPAEVIQGVRRILRDVVEPHVDSPYARSRLAEVRAVLAQVDWNDSLTHLAQDNVAVGMLAEEARGWLARVGDGPADAVRLRSEVESLLPAFPLRPEPFAVHLDRHRAGARVMIGLSDALVEWLREHPSDPVAGQLLQRIRVHYARLDSPTSPEPQDSPDCQNSQGTQHTQEG